MILSSSPKRVNFRIEENNAEITSIESLQQFFNFERFLIDERKLLIRWLKNDETTQDIGKKIEELFDQSKDKKSDIDIVSANLPKIMNILYEPEDDFNSLVDFVDFLYSNDANNHYQVVKSNFIHFINNHWDKLPVLFPIDSIKPGNHNLTYVFSSLNLPDGKARYLSQLFYKLGNIKQSQRFYPRAWELGDKEREAIKEIILRNTPSVFQSVISSHNLSIIGIEFIFLSAIGYLSVYGKDNHIRALSELIDQAQVFKQQRDCIGGSFKKLVNKKKSDFFNTFEKLGYTDPHDADPLFNEKLFLSSFSADSEKRNEIRMRIIKKSYFYPALFVHGGGNYKSRILQSQEKAKTQWFNNILDYHDNPAGLDGDTDGLNENTIIRHQFIENRSIMDEYFCRPNMNMISQSNDDRQPRKQRIERIQSGIEEDRIKKYASIILGNSSSPVIKERFGRLNEPKKPSKKEEDYLAFFKEVINICNNWSEYLDTSSHNFTIKANSLIEKYKERENMLFKERLFVRTILYLIKHSNKNNNSEIEKEIKELEETYIPISALYGDNQNQLSANDRIILDWTTCEKQLNNDCRHSSNKFVERIEFYDRILRRWIANFVYYI